MTTEYLSPILIKPIPPQVINEGGAYRPLDLKDFIQSPNITSGSVSFKAELEDGRPLPKGLVCTGNGLISGIPAKGTQGEYEFVIVAENDSGIPLVTQLHFSIRPRISVESNQAVSELKAQIWQAIENNLPTPEITELLNRSITSAEIYYLLERFAFITIWDVYNLDLPGEPRIIHLAEASTHFHVYDRGSCLVAAPKELFSHERTLEDGLKTARALAREVYQRGWVIEFAGFDKMIRAAWIELQLLADKFGKPLEVLHYAPTFEDVKLYAEVSRSQYLDRS